ncbi:hypothetical protein Goklo_017272 [Gossypium klotzschianum]|uniref:Uncharacterized protein n=1 Tax=Gossypium klotzschianum TaxID=34286 RepID=A0A7J8UGY5_9ROSI|nr:hypothetical protein [Gossypium klotzschianum]
MEACFFSSNSFIKTIEFEPSIKPKTLPFPNTNSNLFYSTKVASPSSITCKFFNFLIKSYFRDLLQILTRKWFYIIIDFTNVGCLSNDEKKPTLDSDWRSFRAKLVATEKVSSPSAWAGSDTVVDQPPQPVTIGDKWAHTIREPEKGCLLIATKKLDGVHIFERTVILLLKAGSIGPLGIILNQSSLKSIKEMRSTTIRDVSEVFSHVPLFFGGPLEDGFFLVSPTKDDDDGGVEKSGVFEEVMKGLYYGTKESVGYAAEMVKRNVVKARDFRFFDGYCLWDKEQLDEEIKAGFWIVVACSPSVIGLASVGNVGLWEEILGLIGPRNVW